MPLTDLQAKNRLKKPLNAEALKRAQEDNDRQKFHAGLATDESESGPYLRKFLDWVKDILKNEEKFERFKQLLRFPLPSSRMIDKASDEYLKSFAAEDKYVDMEFSTDELKVDGLEYLKAIRFDSFLQKNLFNQQLQASAAVWVVDLPAEPNLEGYAKPIPLLRPFGDLIDLGWDLLGQITYVIFQLEPLKDDDGKILAKRWAVLDDESYRVFVEQNGENEPTLTVNNLHNLGRVPAGFIWSDRLDNRNPLRVQSPLHALFSDLDYYVAGWVFRQHADLYASFPILWSYKSNCKYETTQGEPCNNGKVTIRGTDDAGKQYEHVVDCPACSKKKPIGPGSHLQPPKPIDRESADLREPAGFINAERELLDYLAEKLQAAEDDLREALTGDTNDVDQTGQPVNQDQVQARFEARKAILSYWAREIEATHEDLLSVLLALRYGDQFIKCNANYGTEFHLLSAAQVIADYDAARKAGLPTYQLMARRQRIDKLLAGTSESAQYKTWLMSELEPYPDLQLAQVPAGSDVWELKANFSQYIGRFEREFMSLEIFGKTVSIDARINAISQTLYKYVRETKGLREVPKPAGSESGKPA